VLTIENVNEDGDTVTGRRLELTGVVSEPGAEIDAGNDQSTTADEQGHFSLTVRLEAIGENTFFVAARKPGFTSDNGTIYVTRRRTAAERQALRERRIERQARLEAELRATAQWLDPELLQKNPDKYAGERVVMTGEVMQIREGDVDGSFLLMNTGCETEYEVRICDGPLVHVSYDGETDKTEDDLVTVYGTVEGGLEYETQMGGSNYVGSIEGGIIE
jgi:hypothetical protein